MPVIVPVQLGCCPDLPRCLICPPIRPAGADVVEALIHHYKTERAEDSALEVRFFGGAPPTNEQLEAAGAHALSVRVRPDLLSRAEAVRLRDAGVRHIELDALSFDDGVLKEAGRRYRRSVLVEMLAGLPALGFELGVVLAPGLPRSAFDTCLDDARAVAGHVRTARLHPVLVLNGSRLRELHSRQRYTPLELGEAVTVCRAMMDILEAADVEVIRVGLQPPQDGYGRAVAGPSHSGLRELVESRRTLDALLHLTTDLRPGTHAVVRCAPADETRTRGPLSTNVRTLRAERQLASLAVRPDPTLSRGNWRIEASHG